MSIAGEVLFYVAKRRVLAREPGSVGENAATFDRRSYSDWRQAQLEKQFRDHFADAELAGRDVLDFGCGEGGLSRLAAHADARSVIGIDLSEDRIAAARRETSRAALPRPPSFVVPESAERIPLPDASRDVILCFDVLEHVMSYQAIIREWHRVLRPGGTVLIWWIPWWHPYGPHIESLVPVPWAHVLCSDRELIQTCARIYDLPEFRPRIWDLDEAGRKKPNKWQTLQALPEVNRLTMREFESLSRDAGLQISSRRLTGFGSSTAAKLSHPFLAVPYLREFFTSCVTYRLRKA